MNPLTAPHPHIAMQAQWLLAVLAGLAAVWDVRFRRIPNWLCFFGLAAGILWNGLAPEGAGWRHGLAGLAAGLGLYLPLYVLRARGAGDVKLLAAAGAVAGPMDCLRLFVLASLAGGVLGLLLAGAHGRLRRTMFNVGWILNELSHFRAPHRASPELDVRSSAGLRLPHAVPLAAGVALLILMEPR